MIGSVQYRVVFRTPSGVVECRDILIGTKSPSDEAVKSALYSQHELPQGVEVKRSYWVLPRRVLESEVTWV